MPAPTCLKRNRYHTVATLLLQLALAALLPYADALRDTLAVHAGTHLDAPDGEPCAPEHNEQTCQICRGMGAHRTLAAARHLHSAMTWITPAETLVPDIILPFQVVPLPLDSRPPPQLV